MGAQMQSYKQTLEPECDLCINKRRIEANKKEIIIELPGGK